MSYIEENRQRMTEITFARRNKNYGAYVLRTSYGSTLLRALSYTAGGLLTLMLLGYYLTREEIKSNLRITGQVIKEQIYEVTLPDPEIVKAQNKEKPKLHAVPVLPDAENRVVRVEDSVKVEDQARLQQNTLVFTVKGDGKGDDIVKPDETGGGNETATVAASNTYAVVDELPEYEGGLAALRQFIASHVKYPTEAYVGNEEGTVYVRFVVNEAGVISNCTLLKGAGFGMDEEALRVMALLPAFKKPAKVAGVPVKAYFQLPIRFRLK
jgi:periplasmic protein TonB